MSVNRGDAVWAWDHAGELADALGVPQDCLRVSLRTGQVTVLDEAGLRERTIEPSEVAELLRRAGVAL